MTAASLNWAVNPTLPIVLPLLAAFLLSPLTRVSATLGRLLGPLALLVCIWLVAQLWLAHAGEPFALAIGNFVAPLGIVLYVDRLALLFAALVPTFALLFWPWGQAGERGTRESALLLILVASVTGLALSGDIFNIYVFYELTAVASFGLASVNATGRAYVATVRYLIQSATGSLLALVGIAILYLRAGTLTLADLAQLAPTTLNDPLGLAAFALMLIGFGVKGELFPVNTWVPEVYATAPARVSALLAGLVSKLAVLVVVRLLVLVFHQPEAGQLLLVLGVLGMISGELSAWRAKDLARMLAFSSIGQLGMVFIAFSLPGEIGVLAGLAVALHHLVIKSGLFALSARWVTSMDALAGLGRRSPLAGAIYVLFVLSMIGVPPLPGFWAKLVVLIALAQQGPLELAAMAAILVVTAIEAAYLFRLAVILFSRGEPDAAPAGPKPSAVPEPSLGAGLVAPLLALTLLVATVAIVPVTDGLQVIARQTVDVAGYVKTVFPPAQPPLARKD
jgi:formate hydrogenlyase subunit 3/multisubunit Na+/H+ antiporter MnhD subunit